MFTIDDIKPLVKVPGANAIIVQDNSDLDYETKQEFAKQLKKMLKLPVIFVAPGVEIKTAKVEMEDFGNTLD